MIILNLIGQLLNAAALLAGFASLYFSFQWLTRGNEQGAINFLGLFTAKIPKLAQTAVLFAVACYLLTWSGDLLMYFGN